MAWAINKNVVSSYSSSASAFQDVHTGLTGHSALPIDVNVRVLMVVSSKIARMGGRFCVVIPLGGNGPFRAVTHLAFKNGGKGSLWR